MMLILDLKLLQTLTEHFNIKFWSTNTTPVTHPPPPQGFHLGGGGGHRTEEVSPPLTL